MHPLLLGRRRLLLFAIACIDIAVLLALLLRVFEPRPFGHAILFTLPFTLLYGFVCLSAWWVCRSAPIATTPLMRLLVVQGGATLQAAAVGVGVAAVWAVCLTRVFGIGPDRAGILRDLLVMGVVALLIYPVSVVIHYLMLAYERAREAERNALESQVSAREAEVRALRAQLNPHFLFNSLNSINALIGSDPEGARRMCESLGDFLRRTLALGSRDAVPLQEELSLLDRYFAIEHVRFGERLRVERSVESGAECCLVPPLLLQPLVENAIKHGIAQRVEGGTVKVAATVVEGALRLTVENDVDEDAVRRPGEGVGLQNVRRRLDALAARDARIDTYRENGHFRVTLSLPARRASPALETANVRW